MITIDDLEKLKESLYRIDHPTKLKVSPNDYYTIMSWASPDNSINPNHTLTHFQGFEVIMDVLRMDGKPELC